MSTDIKVTVTRGSNTIAQHVAIQMDNMSTQEASFYGGIAPYFRYNAYSLASNVSFQFQDLLTDEATIDPATGSTAKYRVINQPEYFPDGHWELVVDKMQGL